MQTNKHLFDLPPKRSEGNAKLWRHVEAALPILVSDALQAWTTASYIVNAVVPAGDARAFWRAVGHPAGIDCTASLALRLRRPAIGDTTHEVHAATGCWGISWSCNWSTKCSNNRLVHCSVDGNIGEKRHIDSQ